MAGQVASQAVISDRIPKLDELVRIEAANFAGHPLHHDRSAFNRIVMPASKSAQAGTVFTGAYINDTLVGFCYGRRLGIGVATLPFVSDTMRSGIETGRVLYVELFEVMPGLHGQGNGTLLLQDLAGRALQKGFSHVAGHFRQGASYHIADKVFRDKVARPAENYAGSGETFYYVVARIKAS